MISISSQAEKYRTAVEKRIKRYDKRSTIIIGKFAGKDNVLLIQNAFPIIKKYLDHVRTAENTPAMIHNKLNRGLTVNLRKVLATYSREIRLIFPDIKYIQRKVEEELI